MLRASLTLPVYDTIKKHTKGDDNGFFANFNQRVGASLLSSISLSILLYPLDTVKRCMQLNGGRGQLMIYRGIAEGFSKLYSQQGGITAFYRGAHLFFVKELICAFAQVSLFEVLSPKGYGLQ